MAPLAFRPLPPRRSARLAAKSQRELQLSPKAPTTSRAPRARRLATNTSDLKLPLKPLTICDLCWKGPIAAQYGLFHPPLRTGEGRRVCVGGGYSYFVSRNRWAEAPASGCVWCMFVREILGKRWRAVSATGHMKITVGLCHDDTGNHPPADGQSRLGLVPNDNLCLFETILVYTSADNPAAPYIVMRDPILDVGSPRALSLAKSHLEECVDGHERCNRLSPPSDVRLPTRLVDCTNLDRPRLVHTEGDYGKYLALSYVWGEAQPHQTTRDNVFIYRAGIDASLLPQTIRDAIYVTHQLGFQYLWADSLCIVQDSDEDKLHEIGRMHLIYCRAHLTIIAASASRASDGFLHDRPSEQKKVHSFPFLCPARLPFGEADVGEVRFRERGGQMPPEPIHARGWCLQELCMSPRALIFGQHTFRLKCHTTTRNVGDSFWNAYSDCPDHNLRLPDALLDPGAVFPLTLGSEGWFKLHEQWYDIVDLYTARSLGQPSDKLVACGAIAEAFHRGLRTDYLAGLWRDDLLFGLLSWGPADHSKSRRPTEYRGPSWSWVSFDGRCSFTKYSSRVGEMAIAEVTRCEIILKDPGHPFGEVTGGFLVLHAPLIHCQVVKSETFPNGGYAFGLDLLPTQPGHWPRVRTQVRGFCFWDRDTSSDGLRAGTECQLVPMRRDGTSVGGLIAVLATPRGGTHTESGQVYRRAGRFANITGSLWSALQADKVPLVDLEMI